MYGAYGYTRPLNMLSGQQPLNNTGVLEEGPQSWGEAKVYAVDEWAKWSHPKRVAFLREMVREYAPDPRLRWFTARQLRLKGVYPRDYPAQAAAMLEFVQHNVYYTNEDGESIQSPWRTLQYKNGDCDDMAVLLAAMAQSIAMPNKFVLIGRARNGRMVRWREGSPIPKGVEWFHITVDLGWPVGAPKHWAATEPTVRGAPLGYDLVMHGITMDKHGRPFLPPSHGGPPPNQIQQAPRGPSGSPKFLGALPTVPSSGPSLRPLRPFKATGDYEPSAPTDDLQYVENEPGFFSMSYLQSLSLSTFEAVVSAIAVTAALAAYDRYRR